jgi:hypothetical protein
MTWEEVSLRIDRAIRRFKNKHSKLLDVRANERSLTHKLAECLQLEFEEYDVDCEYNRRGTDVKRLERLLFGGAPSDDLDARTVYPDIIVHRRGEDENVLVIEAKKQGVDDTIDLEKLYDFTHDPQFMYRYGAQVFFEFAPPNVVCKPFNI